MASAPHRPPANDRPHEWLALPGGRIRPVVSVPGEDGPDGVPELMSHAAWLARPHRPCACGRPRLGSGRTCGSVECVARLSDQDAGGQPGRLGKRLPKPDGLGRSTRWARTGGTRRSTSTASSARRRAAGC